MNGRGGLGGICGNQPKDGIGPNECKIQAIAAAAASTAAVKPINSHFKIFGHFDGSVLGARASTVSRISSAHRGQAALSSRMRERH